MRGAAAYARRAHATGVQLVYLTARPERMRPGTEEVLRRFGFPLPGGGVELWMKPDDPSIGDDDFKRSAHARLASLGRLVAAFDNEPGHVNDFRESVPRGGGGAGRHRALGTGVDARPPSQRGAEPRARARGLKRREGVAAPRQCPDPLENRGAARYAPPRHGTEVLQGPAAHDVPEDVPHPALRGAGGAAATASGRSPASATSTSARRPSRSAPTRRSVPTTTCSPPTAITATRWRAAPTRAW